MTQVNLTMKQKMTHRYREQTCGRQEGEYRGGMDQEFGIGRYKLLHTEWINKVLLNSMGFPDGSDSKESACNVGDPGSIPGLGRFPGEGNGYPLQRSCLENSMDRGT